MLGYGLASNSVWVFETGVDEVDGGKFFEVEDAEGVQGETLTAADAQWEAAMLCEDEVNCALSRAEPEVGR